MNQWTEAASVYNAGNRSWLPCTEEFFMSMLEVVPPALMDSHPAFGFYFANGEPWTHTQAGALYLCFRNHPQPACRLATLAELQAELAAAPLPGWRALSAAEIQQALAVAGPPDYEQYQSEEYRRAFQASALHTVYGPENIVYVPGQGWLRNLNQK